MPPPPRRALLAWVPLLLFVAHASYWVPNGEPNTDEGFYGAAARAAARGQLPYRDFAYAQMPLLPYLDGLALRAVGTGLFAQRLVCALWTALAFAAAGWLCRRRGRELPWLLLGSTAALSPLWVYFDAIGKSHAAAGLLLLLAAAFVAGGGPWRRRALGFALCATGAVGCRLTVLPAAGLLGLVLLARAPGGRARAELLAACAAAGLLLLAPFAAAAPGDFWFWTVGFHLQSTLTDVPRWAFLGLAPGALLALGLAAAASGRPRRDAPPEALLAPVALLAIVSQALLKTPYAEYGAPFYLPGLLGAALAVPEGWASSGRRWGALALATAAGWWFRPEAMPDYAPSLARAGAFLEAHTPPEGLLLANTPVLALEAGRELLPGLEMGPFALTTDLPADEAARRHMTTPEALEAAIAQGRVAAVVLAPPGSNLNFAWTSPTLRPTPKERLQPLLASIYPAHFEIAYEDRFFSILLPRRR